MELKLRDLEQDPVSLRLAVETLGDHVNDTYNYRGFSPGDFTIDGTGATAQGVQDVKWPFVNFVDAQSGYAAATFRRPTYWKYGHWEFEIWVSSQAVVADAEVRWAVKLFGWDDGDVVGTESWGVTPAAQDVTMPGVADTLLKVSYSSTTNIDLENVDFLAFRVFRNGGHRDDNFTDEARLIYAEVRFLPGR